MDESSVFLFCLSVRRDPYTCNTPCIWMFLISLSDSQEAGFRLGALTESGGAGE
jgi:hypothetical protein